MDLLKKFILLSMVSSDEEKTAHDKFDAPQVCDANEP